jgi:hypothetical protein
VSFADILDQHEPAAAVLVDRSKKQLAAAQKLLKAIQTGSVRDLDKLKAAAGDRVEESRKAADQIVPVDFDAEGYLKPDGAFFTELEDAANEAGVRLFVRDGIVFCYPVLVRTEPSERALRIDKTRTASIRPSTLVAALKALQQKDEKANPKKLLGLLWSAYPYAIAFAKATMGSDVRLTDLYSLLTLGPDAKRDYTLLDFTRDIYLLDISGVDQIGNQRVSFSASTATRESKGSVLRFVDRDGHEKIYSRIRFVPVPEGGRQPDGAINTLEVDE